VVPKETGSFCCMTRVNCRSAATPYAERRQMIGSMKAVTPGEPTQRLEGEGWGSGKWLAPVALSTFALRLTERAFIRALQHLAKLNSILLEGQFSKIQSEGLCPYKR